MSRPSVVMDIVVSEMVTQCANPLKDLQGIHHVCPMIRADIDYGSMLSSCGATFEFSLDFLPRVMAYTKFLQNKFGSENFVVHWRIAGTNLESLNVLDIRRRGPEQKVAKGFDMDFEDF